MTVDLKVQITEKDTKSPHGTFFGPLSIAIKRALVREGIAGDDVYVAVGGSEVSVMEDGEVFRTIFQGELPEKTYVPLDAAYNRMRFTLRLERRNERHSRRESSDYWHDICYEEDMNHACRQPSYHGNRLEGDPMPPTEGMFDVGGYKIRR